METIETPIRTRRSELWHKIYNIISQLPRQELGKDGMDIPSAATELEILFKKEKQLNGNRKKMVG